MLEVAKQAIKIAYIEELNKNYNNFKKLPEHVQLFHGMKFLFRNNNKLIRIDFDAVIAVYLLNKEQSCYLLCYIQPKEFISWLEVIDLMVDNLKNLDNNIFQIPTCLLLIEEICKITKLEE